MMRYHYTVDQTKVKNAGPLPDEIKTRISYRIISLHAYRRLQSMLISPEEGSNLSTKNTDQSQKKLVEPIQVDDNVVKKIHADFRRAQLSFIALGALFEEIDLDYQRCARISGFEVELPYSEEKYTLFKDILPSIKFLPPSIRSMNEPPLNKRI